MIVTQISLRSRLKVSRVNHASVEKTLEHYERRCAVSESVRRAITNEWQSEIEQESGSASNRRLCRHLPDCRGSIVFAEHFWFGTFAIIGRKTMPYSYSRLFAEFTGRNFDNRPIFDPPKLAP